MNRAELIELTRGYQTAALIMALVELDIATTLTTYGEAGATVDQLAQRLGLQTRPLAALLMAARAAGLLDQRGEQYTNTPLSAECLASGGAGYLGTQVKSYAAQYRGWADLPLAVRTGQTVLPDLQNETEGAAFQKLIMGLHAGAQAALPQITPWLAPYLTQTTALLDLGCGAGSYGLAWAEQYPALQVTLLDRPAVLEIAARLVEISPASSRVRLCPADYHTDNLSESAFDLVLLFQVLRTESVQTGDRLLAKVAQALKPGGRLVVLDSLLNDDQTGPLENVFQNLTMTMMYSAGGLSTVSQLTERLSQAGFWPPATYPVAANRPLTLLVAQKGN